MIIGKEFEMRKCHVILYINLTISGSLHCTFECQNIFDVSPKKMFTVEIFF